MTISFRTVRYLGLGILLLIIAVVSLMSYAVMSSTADKLENIITVEEHKLHKWHSLFELVTDANNSVYDYYMGRKRIMAATDLLIKKAIDMAEELREQATDENELEKMEVMIKDLRKFRQVVYVYAQEARSGDRSGTSVKEMETVALKTAEEIVHTSHLVMDEITSKIQSNNVEMLKVTELYKKMLGIALIVSVFLTIIVAFVMGRALARPVNELVGAASRIAKGDFDQEIEVRSSDEIGGLASSFNRMTKDLKEQREKLVDKDYVDSIIANMNDALIVTTPEARIKTVNRAVCDMLGYKEEELIGQKIGFLFPKEERALFGGTVLEQLAKKGRVTSFETDYRTKTGRLIPVLFSGSVMKDAGGSLTNLICTARDITGIKESEKALIKQSQELIRAHTELQRIIFIASHDLQEPLRQVSSYVQLLSKRYKDRLDNDAEDFINFIVDGTKRMNMLIKGLLAYSRVSTAGKEFKNIDCNEVLAQVLTDMTIFIKSNKARVTYDRLPEITADRDQIARLFQSLIDNALRFRGEALPAVHVSARNDNDMWVFSVKDNGTGIEQKHRDKIFQIFQRVSQKSGEPGPSIGLAVCKRIVERHGGQMWVDSEPGKGSTFYFTIPVRKGKDDGRGKMEEGRQDKEMVGSEQGN